MPRVADIYSRPAGIDAIPNQTIESVDYNLNVADVEADLNLPRPIVAGGTGASNATQARDNLDAEVASTLVTNYNSHTFESGSFHSNAGATGAPVAGHAFTGTAVVHGLPNYISIEARDVNDTVSVPGRLYVRQKIAGVWGAWGREGFTEVSGGTFIENELADMSFGLTGTAPNSYFFVNSESNGTGANFLKVNKSDGRVSLNVLTMTLDEHATSKQYVDSTTVSIAGDTMTGPLVTTGSVGPVSAVSPAPGIVVTGAASQAAYLTFNRPGVFGASLGIDTDNTLCYGGWSLGAIAHKIFHEGNTPSSTQYIKFPSGLQFVFGVGDLAAGDGWVTFPVAFPTACAGVVASPVAAGNAVTRAFALNIETAEVTRFFGRTRHIDNGGIVGLFGYPVNYIAWGY